MRRDWLPREADIYVCDNQFALSYNMMCELESKCEKVMSLSQLATYVKEKMWELTHPNEEMEKIYNEIKEIYLKELNYRKIGIWDTKLEALEGNQLDSWNSLIFKRAR